MSSENYTGLFFPEVEYVRYDILCFLEAGSRLVYVFLSLIHLLLLLEREEIYLYARNLTNFVLQNCKFASELCTVFHSSESVLQDDAHVQDMRNFVANFGRSTRK
jgi:hypothetical protein